MVPFKDYAIENRDLGGCKLINIWEIPSRGTRSITIYQGMSLCGWPIVLKNIFDNNYGSAISSFQFLIMFRAFLYFLYVIKRTYYQPSL